MSNKPLVTVVTPAYNAERFLSEAIESILNQTYENIEYILIDDASTDNTKDIINKYAKKDNRIKTHFNAKNLNIGGVRNQGVKLAKGKYIAWQDADDISLPTRIEKQVEFMESNPKVGMCGSFIEFFEDNGNHHIRKYLTEDSEIRKKMFRYAPAAEPASILRMECFKKAGEYDPTLPPAADIDMSFRIGQHYKFANIPEVLLRYRVHPQSATSQKLKVSERNTKLIRNKYKNHPAYTYTFADAIYNFLQEKTAALMPAPFRIRLFNFLRSKNLI